MKLLQVADAVRYERMTTDEIREAFLADELAIPGSLELRYIDLDRTVVGFAVPTINALELPCPAELRAEFFCQRRELGILNVGGPGMVTVDGTEFSLDKL